MTRWLLAAFLLASLSEPAAAQEQLDLELMTYPEVAAAMQHGKTTVLVYSGGTEQRGPHAVLGGHTLIARRAGVEIARQLGNALLAPVLPYSIAGTHLNPKWPGSINLPGPVYSAVTEAVVDSMVVNGFKNIVLMGDHAGGQTELQALAFRMDRKYAAKGTRVLFCGDLYEKTRKDVAAYIAQHNLPASTHAGISDTSVLMFLGGDAYVRRDKLAAAPRPGDGVSGDPRQSTPEMGKIFFDMQVRNAVTQIRALTGSPPARAR